jgi:transposase-like protein
MQRRKFRPEFKLQCVLDILSGRKSPAQIGLAGAFERKPTVLN